MMHSSVVYDAKMIMFGGYDGSVKNDAWTLDLTSYAWTQLMIKGDAPKPRVGHCSIVYNKKMTVFGGNDGSGAKKDDAWSLDLTSYAWTELTTSGTKPSKREGQSCICFNGKMVMFGGLPHTLFLVAYTNQIPVTDKNAESVDEEELNNFKLCVRQCLASTTGNICILIDNVCSFEGFGCERLPWLFSSHEEEWGRKESKQRLRIMIQMSKSADAFITMRKALNARQEHVESLNVQGLNKTDQTLMIMKLDKVVEKKYNLVYCHTGMNWFSRKHFSWLKEAYGVLVAPIVYQYEGIDEPKLFFGSALQNQQQNEENGLPIFLESVTTFLLNNGALSIEGIFRIPGNTKGIERYIDCIEKGESLVDIYENESTDEGFSQLDHLHIIGGALKAYLRDLPTSLIPAKAYQPLIDLVKGQNSAISSENENDDDEGANKKVAKVSNELKLVDDGLDILNEYCDAFHMKIIT
eukprot:g8072.t1